MIQFPMKFEVSAIASEGMQVSWTSQARGLMPIPCSIPVEFMGPGDGYSPEDLFALAVINCLIATYKVYCEKSKVTFSEISAKAVVIADKNPGSQGFIMSEIVITVKIAGASNPESARKIFDAAIRDCAIGNSINAKKAFHVDIG